MEQPTLRQREATSPSVPSPGPSARFERSLAVVIGIDTYGDGISPLRSAVADARAIAEVLQRDHGFVTRCLFDDDAQLPALLTLLREELPSQLGPRDRLLLYFAGHGIALDGEAGPAGYLIPARAGRAERDGFLPMHVVHGALSRLAVHHALIILDCCFSGTFRWSSLRDIEPGAPRLYRERYERYVESPAWQVLTSASADQLALDALADTRGDGASGHSPFALAILDGLAGAADYTQDGVITADELAMYARDRVAPAAESIGRRQVPQLFPLDRHDGGQFVFLVPGRPLELTSAPPLDEAANPYRGLQSFREVDRSLFFGRELAVQRLHDAVVANPLTAVVGPSGSGKSSLVHAGLVPALRAIGWTVLTTQRPGREPLAALDAWTRELGCDAAPRRAVESWVAAAVARASREPDRPWLVVVDQLEELLTHRTTPSDRTEFLDGLASALRAARTLHVVVVVRSDAEPQLHDTALEPWWATARFVVTAMNRDELRRAIEQPAAAAVLHFQPSQLVERLLDDVAQVPAPLPLLSFALSELYRRCWVRWQGGVVDRALRESDYAEMGSVARALTQRASALHDQLVADSPACATTIRNLFIRMVAVVGGELARRRVPRSELEYDDPDEDLRVADVLQRFHEARLISLGTDAGGGGPAGAYAEPTHDELVRGWTKVSAWLDELDATAGMRALLSALGDAVRAWRAHGQDDRYLWNDPRADLVNMAGRSRRFLLNAGEARFVACSVRRRRSRLLRLIGGLLAVIALLAAATGAALRQRANANRSAAEASQQKAAAEQQLGANYLEQGRSLLLDHPAQALPYLVEARALSIEGPVVRMLVGQVASQLPRATLVGHSRVVRAVAFSRDGTRVVTASADETARVWDATTGAPVTLELRHRGFVNSAAFSPDGTRVVTSSHDQTARVWDARTGAPVTPPLEHQGVVVTAAFSPDGTRVLTASYDLTAQIWDAATGARRTPPLQHPGIVVAAAFSPDGARVVTVSSDRATRLWDAATGKLLTALVGRPAIVTAAAFSPDGTRVVTATEDSAAQVWNAATGKPVGGPLRHPAAVEAVAFTADGTRVVTASRDHVVRVWDAATGSAVAQLEHAGSAFTPVFGAGGTKVVMASDDRTVAVWDVTTGRPVTGPLEDSERVVAAAFSADGTRVATATSNGIARIWDATGGPTAMPRELAGKVSWAALTADGMRMITRDGHAVRVWDATTWQPATVLEDREPLATMAFSPDGTRMVAANESRAQLWDMATGKPLAQLLGPALPVTVAAFSPDRTRVVTASGSRAQLWDAATGKPLAEMRGHTDWVVAAAFSPDSARIVTASRDATARIWDATTGMSLLGSIRHSGPINAIVFSPDGKNVASATDDHARVWSAITGELSRSALDHRGSVETVAFSPDGARVVTASADGTARVWDANKGQPLTPPLPHHDAVTDAAFSPDGARVVTASRDQTAVVWDAATGRKLAPLQHPEAVMTAAFTGTGEQVVTTSRNGTVRVWTVPVDAGSLDDWRQLAGCGPFVLANAVLVGNPRPAAMCRHRSASSPAPRPVYDRR